MCGLRWPETLIMSSPIVPSDFKELIPAPGGNLCEKLAKNLLRRLPERLYAMVAYERDENGDLSDDFKADVCALECFCAGGGGDGTIDTTLNTPINVSATDGTYSDKVRVTWSAVDNATKYYIYRRTDATTPSINQTPLAVITAPTVQYDDTSAVPGQVYYYWIRAASANEISNLSNSDSGYAENVATNEVRFENPGTVGWVVPAGVTTIDVRLIGAGGSGGGGGLAVATTKGLGGGGGGGGGYTESLNIPVTAGETLMVEVGAGGIHSGTGHAGGNSLGIAGVSGGVTKLLRSSTVLALANGGIGGGAANSTSSGTPGTGGAGGSGDSNNGTAGGDGIQVTTRQGIGGIGGAAGTTIYSQKGYGGNGQRVIGRAVIEGEGGTVGGTTVPIIGPTPSPGENGIVVIFY